MDQPQTGVKKHEFHKTDKHLGNEGRFYLATNEHGQVFVLHEWLDRQGDSFRSDSEHIELEVFLSQQGSAQDALRSLIATLVDEA